MLEEYPRHLETKMSLPIRDSLRELCDLGSSQKVTPCVQACIILKKLYCLNMKSIPPKPNCYLGPVWRGPVWRGQVVGGGACVEGACVEGAGCGRWGLCVGACPGRWSATLFSLSASRLPGG